MGVETPSICASCGRSLTGENYCSHCGEEVFDASKLTLKYFQFLAGAYAIAQL